MRWVFPKNDPGALETAARLTRELRLPPLVARLLVIRGFSEPEAADRFLHPRLDHLHDPFLMADMTAAVARVRQAIERREKILIYGDYDVDGTMAVVVLLTALRALGASVEVHIPHRLTDGYGMRGAVLERAAEAGTKLVVSVDTGVREYEALGRARELGLDCIVTDHHLAGERLPPACAILNPHRTDCGYPDKNLSGVGVAFKLAQALLGLHPAGPAANGSRRMVESYLKVVALGTIADVVPLVGENRVIAHYGLAGLRQPTGPGLRALIAVCGLAAGEAVTAGHVGFRLAPRLNAAGRMESARDVIDLFSAAEAGRAQEIAERLDRLNRERQAVEESMVGEVAAKLEARPDLKERFALVVAGEGWHRGVIGIVAQRVAERYHRPALVIGVEEGEGVGSGRSIPGFHLLSALQSVADVFERFGGHAQAAGFTLAEERIPELEARFESYARATLKLEDLEPALRVDTEVTLTEIDGALYEQLQRLSPHGVGNPTPVFAARGLRVCASPRVLKERHLKLRVGQDSRVLDALAWGWGPRAVEWSAGQAVEAAFTLDENEYQGVRTLQLELKDLRSL
ncbi:MAG TPA: single-stranded-DNA-specific exonuclease RecJ [Terriglobia bacterium]|nr:single-stranded-DNA-specific exonuclease RecJ [Terriglobia bacterium]